jgi:hypothetical protein
MISGPDISWPFNDCYGILDLLKSSNGAIFRSPMIIYI